MYIVYETVASNDPRLTDNIQKIGQFWHYSVARVLNNERVDWLKGTELPEHVAKSWILATSNDGEITVLRSDVGSLDEMILPSSGGDQGYYKETYFLTEQDKTTTKNFIQAVLKLEAEKLVADGNKNPTDIKTKLKAEVDAALTLNDVQMVMKSYFDCDPNAYTAGKSKNSKFQVNW